MSDTSKSLSEELKNVRYKYVTVRLRVSDTYASLLNIEWNMCRDLPSLMVRGQLFGRHSNIMYITSKRLTSNCVCRIMDRLCQLKCNGITTSKHLVVQGNSVTEEERV